MLDTMQQADFTQILPRFHADFMQNSLQNAMRNISGIQANINRILANPCGIYPCLIHAWFHTASRFHRSFMQISLRIPCRVLWASNRTPSSIEAESIRYLPMHYPCLIPCSKQILRKFYADFIQNSLQNAMQNISGIQSNPSPIHT